MPVGDRGQDARHGRCGPERAPERLPDQVFARTVRRLFERQPGKLCELLGLRERAGARMLGPDEGALPLPGALILLRVIPGRIEHVEVVVDVPPDLELRMTRHGRLVMDAYPDDVVAHHVLVLGAGTVGSGPDASPIDGRDEDV